MKLKEFQTLQKGDFVYIYCNAKRDTTMGTEVLDIDRMFGKVKVLCHPRKVSYKYVMKKAKIYPSYLVGTCKSNY